MKRRKIVGRKRNRKKWKSSRDTGLFTWSYHVYIINMMSLLHFEISWCQYLSHVDGFSSAMVVVNNKDNNSSHDPTLLLLWERIQVAEVIYCGLSVKGHFPGKIYSSIKSTSTRLYIYSHICIEYTGYYESTAVAVHLTPCLLIKLMT